MTVQLSIPKDVKAHVAIIGGSGLYQADIIEDAKEVKVYTPYGEPSDNITIGYIKGVSVAFLPRHGKGHRFPPHMVNYRANIWALKSIGAKYVISVSAVGSLNENMKPGDFVIPNQFIDMTKLRKYTFFDGPITVHVSMADPFCDDLSKKIFESSKSLNYRSHLGGTYICIEGPRFSTRAESRVWKEVFKADIIGMTLVPEINLACEAQMCYSTLAMVTDYDVWAEKPVTAAEVEKVMTQNIEGARKILYDVVPKLKEDPDENHCSCCKALEHAIQ
ncbi:MAG: S-methyl-5'-thioadenosine phosphorylase [Caldisphaera sp.]|uniref:S-methyl-5'-thioadenosine phosphorylase n=1 Tax=Caldisphaera sp. TaxID=2060322 RepID=UPI0025B9BC2D|nr:S-methyl-5'-thioadenosine phosphorylase [Caldisphaera sp.]